MSNFLSDLGVKANGTINPSTFITGDTTTDFAVIAAVGNVPILGIAQVGTKISPGLQNALFPGTTPVQSAAAYQGDELEIFVAGDVTSLLVGSGSVAPWDLLTNDGNSAALTAAPGSGKYVGAVAINGGNPGELIRALCLPYGTKA